MVQLSCLRRVTKDEEEILNLFRHCDVVGQQAVRQFMLAAIERTGDRQPDNVVPILSKALALIA